jgi:transposase
MTRQQYDAEFKSQAVELVRRKTKPASRIAEELGVPRKTLYRWLEAGRQHPAEPFVGSGRLRAEDQRMRELERTVRDLQEENAILKKAMRIFANGQK